MAQPKRQQYLQTTDIRHGNGRYLDVDAPDAATGLGVHAADGLNGLEKHVERILGGLAS